MSYTRQLAEGAAALCGFPGPQMSCTQGLKKDTSACCVNLQTTGSCMWARQEFGFPSLVSYRQVMARPRLQGLRGITFQAWDRFYQIFPYPQGCPFPHSTPFHSLYCTGNCRKPLPPANSLQQPLLRKVNIVGSSKERCLKEFYH